MYLRASTMVNSFLLITFVGMLSSIFYFVNQEPGTTASAAPMLKPLPTDTVIFEPTADPDWSVIQPGLEKRVMEIYNSQNQLVESVHIWRLDQSRFRLDVAHTETPKSLDTWQQETNAAIVVNGGYYSIVGEKYIPDGLTIVDGRASGRSFAGFGGMLAIDGERAELRWLEQQPYDPSESLQAALQAFPMLVEPGGTLGFGAERENHVNARRTVIAQDRIGRILLIVAPSGYFTL